MTAGRGGGSNKSDVDATAVPAARLHEAVARVEAHLPPKVVSKWGETTPAHGARKREGEAGG